MTNSDGWPSQDDGIQRRGVSGRVAAGLAVGAMLIGGGGVAGYFALSDDDSPKPATAAAAATGEESPENQPSQSPTSDSGEQPAEPTTDTAPEEPAPELVDTNGQTPTQDIDTTPEEFLSLPREERLQALAYPVDAAEGAVSDLTYVNNLDISPESPFIDYNAFDASIDDTPEEILRRWGWSHELALNVHGYGSQEDPSVSNTLNQEVAEKVADGLPYFYTLDELEEKDVQPIPKHRVLVSDVQAPFELSTSDFGHRFEVVEASEIEQTEDGPVRTITYNDISNGGERTLHNKVAEFVLVDFQDPETGETKHVWQARHAEG